MGKLPFSTKVIYGLGGLGMNLCDLVFLQWLMYRYAAEENGALLTATTLGWIIFLGRVGECFYNVGIGHWSDNCRSRWGRRLPFIRFGMVPLALVFLLLYTPPPGWSGASLIAYVYLFLNAYLFFYGFVVTPYLSLMPEMTSDPHERVNLTTSQSVFVVVSFIIFGFIGEIVEQWSWFGAGALVAVITVAALAPVAFTVREPDKTGKEIKEKPRFVQAAIMTLENPAFRVIALSTSAFWFSVLLVLTLLPFWVTEVLGRSKGDVTTVMIPYLVVTIVSFFFWNVLTKRFGKFAMLLVTYGGSAVCFAVFAAAGHFPWGTPFQQTIVVMGLFGIPVAGFMVIPFTLLADAVDYDEKRTGHRREAIFFGMQGVAQKGALGLAALSFGYLSETNGVVTELGLRKVLIAGAIGCVVAFIIFLKYPLRDRAGHVYVLGETD